MVLRLVELNGSAADARVRVPGEVAAAFRTNMMGEIEHAIVAQAIAPAKPGQLPWSELTVACAPYQIVTIYLDLVLARKVPRDLDSYRSVWATIHRVE